MVHRLFVALRPPAEVREHVIGLMGGLEGARWQTDNQLHVTLAFIGEVDRHGLAAAQDALSNVQVRPFQVKLGVMGSFEAARAGRIGALWVGVQPVAEISDLAQSVRKVLQRAGLKIETRKFVPHMTLARFGAIGGDREAIRPWLETAHPLPLAWNVTDFHLVESFMGRGGSHYRPITSYELV